MKLNIGIATALAGCAAAVQPAADVFILRDSADSSSTTTPAITPSLARLLLLQRLAPTGKGPSVNDIPEGADLEEVVSVMNQFGPAPIALFDDIAAAASPSQLLIMLEGLTNDQMGQMSESLKLQPSLRISNPPSSTAHDQLIGNDFYNAGVTKEHECTISQVTNPFEEQCWSGKSTVARYNIQNNPEALSELSRLAPNLVKLASSGEMETIIVLFPTTAGKSQPDRWSDKNQELRRRQEELVISALDEERPTESGGPVSPAASSDEIFYISTKEGPVPACFSSKESCESGTGSCSGHGNCENKYARSDGSDDKETCYVCRCLGTPNDSGSITHWAGKTCSKKDVSTPFWLFAGFTLVMLGIVSLSIGMLFSVGEEKLPGVIGAGVSRSK